MFAKDEINRHERIAGELSAIRNGLKRSWCQIAQLLKMVEACEYWRSDNETSFTAWLRRQMPLFGLKEALLWRFVMAGRHYDHMLPKLREWGVSTLPLEQLSAKVSPENLEILGRLMHVAPEEELRVKAEMIISATANRSDIRNWLASYRPALKANIHKTGKSTEKDVLGDNAVKPRLVEAMIRNSLLNNSTWTGLKDPFVYRIFQDTPLLGKTALMDLVVVVKERRGQGELLYHGIEVKANITHLESDPAWFRAAAPFFDYLWLALPVGSNFNSLPQAPSFDYGIMTVGDNTVSVICHPRQRSDGKGTRRGDLAGALLERFL